MNSIYYGIVRLHDGVAGILLIFNNKESDMLLTDFLPEEKLLCQ